MNIYNDFKQNNSEIVNENAWEITYEDTQMLENLPILHKAKQDSEHIYPAVSKTTIVKTAEYISDIERLAKDFVDIPKADRKGQAKITNDKIDTIKRKTLENIQLVALNNQVSLYEALTLFSDQIKLSSKAKKEIITLVKAVETAKQSSLPLHEMFENLMNDVGYIDMLKKDLEDNRIDNIHELQRSIYEFQNQNPDIATIENYLQEISLYTDNDNLDDGQYVSLMSIHMAKGLEFDYVFVLGLSEGIFPSFRALSESDEGLEEERRLAYVAFTRARKQLFLTDSEGFSFVTDSPKISSRFIDEIGSEGIKHVGTKPRFKTANFINTAPTKEELVGNNEVTDWSNGDFVLHDTFGKGVVVKVNGNTLDIAFELPAGLKTLMANHKALKKLTN